MSFASAITIAAALVASHPTAPVHPPPPSTAVVSTDALRSLIERYEEIGTLFGQNIEDLCACFRTRAVAAEDDALRTEVERSCTLRRDVVTAFRLALGALSALAASPDSQVPIASARTAVRAIHGRIADLLDAQRALHVLSIHLDIASCPLPRMEVIKRRLDRIAALSEALIRETGALFTVPRSVPPHAPVPPCPPGVRCRTT